MRQAKQLRRNQLHDVGAKRLRPQPSGQGFGMRAPVQDDAGFVGLDKGVERGPDDGLRQLLTVDQSLMRLLLQFLFGADLGRHFRKCARQNGDLPAAIRR